jgi:peptide/nickel transport system permease protein
MRLLRWLVRRVAAALIVLFLASILVFAGVHALPGDAAAALGAQESNPQSIAQIRHQYGLDQPLPIQYARWISHAARGDLGRSIQNGLSVGRTIGQRLPITLELAGLGILIAVLIGVPAGVIAAVRRGKPSDYASTGVALVGLSIPNFALGLILIFVFAVHLHVLPASGYVAFADDPVSNLKHMLMPAFVLGVGLAAVIMRQMRSAMLDSLRADYVRTARAKGLSEWSVVCVHALRNSLITVITIVSLHLGALISGAVVTEQVFLIPGFGKLIVDSVFARDFPVVEGVVLVSAAAYVFVNLMADLIYALVDPRVRASGMPN